MAIVMMMGGLLAVGCAVIPSPEARKAYDDLAQKKKELLERDRAVFQKVKDGTIEVNEALALSQKYAKEIVLTESEMRAIKEKYGLNWFQAVVGIVLAGGGAFFGIKTLSVGKLFELAVTGVQKYRDHMTDKAKTQMNFDIQKAIEDAGGNLEKFNAAVAKVKEKLTG